MKMVVIGLVIATLSKILADEVKEYLIWLPRKMIQWAASLLPSDLAKRFEEEWLGHHNDLPGNLAKLSHGVGCIVTSVRVANVLPRSMVWAAIRFYIEARCILSFFEMVLRELRGDSMSLTPDQLRLRSLQQGMGGLCTLGLKRLELTQQETLYIHDHHVSSWIKAQKKKKTPLTRLDPNDPRLITAMELTLKATLRYTNLTKRMFRL